MRQVGKCVTTTIHVYVRVFHSFVCVSLILRCFRSRRRASTRTVDREIRVSLSTFEREREILLDES